MDPKAKAGWKFLAAVLGGLLLGAAIAVAPMALPFKLATLGLLLLGLAIWR